MSTEKHNNSRLPNEAASDIKKFAEEKEKSLAQFSMGGNNEIAIKQMIFKTLESGEKWILLENFQNACPSAAEKLLEMTKL